MASSAAKAARRADAQRRLEAEVQTIAERLEVQLPQARITNRDVDLAAIQQIEHQADVLAAINAAIAAAVDSDIDLSDMTRDELNAEAERRGIEGAAGLRTKQDVIDAIEEAG